MQRYGVFISSLVKLCLKKKSLNLGASVKCTEIYSRSFCSFQPKTLGDKFDLSWSMRTPCPAAFDTQITPTDQQIRNRYKFRDRYQDRRRVRKQQGRRSNVQFPESPVTIDKFPVDDEAYYDPSGDVEIVSDSDFERLNEQKSKLVGEVNDQINERRHGRLFAVIYLAGSQFKVTAGDIVVIQGDWQPTIGDRIRVQKILLVGSTDFTIIGKPLISPEIVRLEGTVIEKTLSFTKINFVLKKRKEYRRFRFHKTPYTMVRINLIEFLRGFNSIGEFQDSETDLKKLENNI